MKTAGNDNSLIQLVYVSAATVEFHDQDLDILLERARQTNASLDVTGILLFTDGTFFQVLEGAIDAVQRLYDKIELDERHNNVLLLAKNEIQERNFGDWSMGFVRGREAVVELAGFVDFFEGPANSKTFVDLHGDSQRIRQVLDGFRRGRWRRQATESDTSQLAGK